MITFLIGTITYFSWFAAGQEAQYQDFKQQLEKLKQWKK